MKTAVLLVIWVAIHQQPVNYEVEFSSRDECEAAREAVIRDGRGIGATTAADAPPPGTMTLGTPVLRLSAVCVEKTRPDPQDAFDKLPPAPWNK